MHVWVSDRYMYPIQLWVSVTVTYKKPGYMPGFGTWGFMKRPGLSDNTDADVESARCCPDFAGVLLLAWMGVLMAIYSLAHAAITCSER